MYPAPFPGFFLPSFCRLMFTFPGTAAIELDSAKDPFADALQVIEFEQPYLSQFQVMGIAECSRAG